MKRGRVFTRVHGEMLLKWHWKEKGLVTPPLILSPWREFESKRLSLQESWISIKTELLLRLFIEVCKSWSKI